MNQKLKKEIMGVVSENLPGIQAEALEFALEEGKAAIVRVNRLEKELKELENLKSTLASTCDNQYTELTNFREQAALLEADRAQLAADKKQLENGVHNVDLAQAALSGKEAGYEVVIDCFKGLCRNATLRNSVMDKKTKPGYYDKNTVWQPDREETHEHTKEITSE